MSTTQSDMRNEDKQSHKTTVREFLREHEEVALKDAIRAGTDVPAWYIDQIASADEFYTSINHNGAYVASKYIIGARGRHDCLWRPEVDDGIAVFHREEPTKAALKELAAVLWVKAQVFDRSIVRCRVRERDGNRLVATRCKLERDGRHWEFLGLEPLDDADTV